MAKFVFTKIVIVIPLVILSLVFSFTLLKSRVAGITVVLSFAFFMSLVSIVIGTIEKDYEEEVVWSLNADKFTSDFTVGNEGHLYLKAQINGAPGLFLFDTGCGVTVVNEKYISNGSLKWKHLTIKDANGIRQNKPSHIVREFELGDISIRNLKTYPLDSLTWTSSDGIFFGHDSVVGVLGNDIISKFTWDFDLLNQCVTVSNNKAYCSTLSDSLAIDLVSKNNVKEIPVFINETAKMLLLDFGCSSPIILSDSIPQGKESEKEKITFYQARGKGGLNHLDSINNQTIDGSFVDIKFGKYEYNNIRCVNNNHADLLGIPFIWSFERVVLDFPNNKSYFISANLNASQFSVKNHSWQSVIDNDNTIELYPKPGGTVISIESESKQVNYVAFGYTKLYKQKGRVYRMFCQDSVRLPDGKTINGPVTMELNN
ncbi:retropepsin-like aspartic protease [Maribellus sediminis]|uniref:retropepsin-like aspartic protease n=1 Tax=Maribellus sediminis TaxID=2696285 RepID=UPI001431A90B|nr:retropepsin-like aspartic protease [Maribellus sediminis]